MSDTVGDRMKRQADMTETDTSVCFLDTNKQCVWAQCFSQPVCLSLSSVHIAFPPFLFLSLTHTHKLGRLPVSRALMKSRCQQSPSLLTRGETNEGSGRERTGWSHTPLGIHEYTLVHWGIVTWGEIFAWGGSGWPVNAAYVYIQLTHNRHGGTKYGLITLLRL